MLLRGGRQRPHVPFEVLLYLGGRLHRDPAGRGLLSAASSLIRAKRRRVVRAALPAAVPPVTIVALLATLVLIFAFQAENIIEQLVPRAC